MIIHLSEDSKGLEKRAFKILRHYYIDANIKDSWSRVFKTKNYKKALKNQEKVLVRYHRIIKRIIRNTLGDEVTCSYKPARMIGSTKLFDVQTKRGQEYIIIVKPKNQ